MKTATQGRKNVRLNQSLPDIIIVVTFCELLLNRYRGI
jgi:hypothetical protein